MNKSTFEPAPYFFYMNWEMERNKEESLLQEGLLRKGVFVNKDITFLERKNTHLNLMWAILNQAIKEATEGIHTDINNSYNPESVCKICDAVDWINNKDFTYIFSFLNICYSLGLDENIIRKYVYDRIPSKEIAI